MTPAFDSSVDVASILASSRRAARAWAAEPIARRTALLKQLRLQIVQNIDLILKTLTEATGKPPGEAMMNEIVPTLEILRYYEKTAARILRREKRPTSFLFPRSRSYVTYPPRGVVVILGPSNFPFHLSLVPAMTALAAGNSVIVKISEHTPLLANLLTELFREAGFPMDVATVLSGPARLGADLAAAGPDLIFLTGSTETGRRVMAGAAQTLTPVILELGGKDPMIVFADAPFERTVRGAVYGAFANAGQVCVSVDRLLVERSVLDRFTEALVEETRRLKLGSDDDSDVGPLASEVQADRFRAVIEDALSKGAVALTPVDIQGRWAHPVVLTKVTSRMRVWKEEIFGPLVSLIPFETEAEAVALANDSPFGLNASIWTRDLAKAERVAAQLVTGNCAVNEVLKNIGNPSLPFGGTKASGIGVYHGPEGLRAFSRPMSVMVNRGRWKREPNWFPYAPKNILQFKLMVNVLYGAGSWIQRGWCMLRLGRELKAVKGDEKGK